MTVCDYCRKEAKDMLAFKVELIQEQLSRTPATRMWAYMDFFHVCNDTCAKLLKEDIKVLLAKYRAERKLSEKQRAALAAGKAGMIVDTTRLLVG